MICVRCVMNESDPDIRFGPDGVCHHCTIYDETVRTHVKTGEAAKRALDELVDKIRKNGRGKDHDCIIGVSGGVDSTYVAYAVKQLGLRPLAVHLDNGWDSELAVKNIEQVLTRLDIPLDTHVLEWDEFRDLQLAFLKASTPDSEIPSDHAIVAVMHQVARREGLRYILSGVNARTESHLPRAWSQGHQDWRYIKSIHARFGTVPLKTFPHRDAFAMVRDQYTLEWIDVLNLLDYRKDRALDVLKNELEWKYYGGKHYESIYTRFYQGVILPTKFGYDKRRSHLSSLICAGEITRDHALAELAKPTYAPELQAEDRRYVVKKLGISDAEFAAIMATAPKRFEDYPSYANSRVLNAIRRVRGAILRRLGR